jgi:hypothetical protein
MKYIVRLIIAIVFIVCAFNHIIFAQNVISDKKMASVSETRKAADVQCRISFGQYDLYDTASYLDADKERSCDVYIYAKNNRWANKKNELLDSVYQYRRLLNLYSDSIKNVQKNISDTLIQESKLTEYRYYTYLYSILSNRPDEFISVYTSASKNHLPIFEYREGLPESYVLRYDIAKKYAEKNISASKEFEFYYFGIVQSFAAVKNSAERKFVNLTGLNDQITEKEVENFQFNKIILEGQSQIAINSAWDKLANNSIEELSSSAVNKGKTTAAVIADVPYFNQWDWTNVLPAESSCVVMSGASVLSYYVNKGFFSITPFASYKGPFNTATAGFSSAAGINYSTNYGGTWGSVNVHLGAETMLNQMGSDFGYDFVNGGTQVGCSVSTLKEKYIKYTNTRLKLNFTYTQDCSTGGHSYAEIKNEIDNNRPMTLTGVSYYSWITSPGSYSYVGGHAVAIVGYNDNQWSGNPAIGVYVNGVSGDRSVVYWSYSAIQNQNSEITLAVTSGGSSGTYISAPTIKSPLNNTSVDQGSVNFTWNSNGAAAYRVQISKNQNFSSYIKDITTTSSSLTYAVNDTGSYYWRIAAQNSIGSWCRFSDTASKFSVNSIKLSASVTALSFGSQALNSTSAAKSYTLKGSSLTKNITISAPTGFQVSANSGVTYSSSLTVVPVSGSVNQIVYVRFSPTAAQSYSGNVTNVINGVTLNVAVTGTGIAPAITASAVSLPSFGGVVVGGYSAVKSFTISGKNLNANIFVTAPTGFQASMSGSSGFASSVSLTPSNGTITAATIYVRFAPVKAQSYAANIVITSSGAAAQFVSVNGTGVTPVITASVSSISSFGSVVVGKYSAIKSYTVSGKYLSANLIVTAPAGFQASTSSSSGFSSSVSLTPNNGIINAATIYVRFAPTAAQSYSANITNTSTGATAQNVAVSGMGSTTGATPSITVSVTSLTTFGSVKQTQYSAAKSYTVSGGNLTSNLVITAPAGFQISKSSATGFSLSISLAPSGGTIAATTIYARFAPTAVLTYSGSITHVSSGAVTKTVSVSGTGKSLLAKELSEINNTAVIDKYLFQNYPNPFNPTTTFSFLLPQRASVDLSIFNQLGAKVAGLLNETLEPGEYRYLWNASGLASGIYFYKLRIDANSIVKKLILLK